MKKNLNEMNYAKPKLHICLAVTEYGFQVSAGTSFEDGNDDGFTDLY